MLKITHAVNVAEKAEKQRAVQIRYRGYPVRVHVGSLREEMELRLSAWLKEKAMGEPSPLPPFGPKGVLMTRPAVHRGKVPHSLEIPWMACQQELHRLLDKEHAKTGPEILKVVEKHGAALLGTDCSCKVEVALLVHLFRLGGQNFMEIEVWHCLPDERVRMTLPASIDALRSVCENKVYVMMPDAVKDGVDVCLRLWSTCNGEFLPLVLIMTLIYLVAMNIRKKSLRTPLKILIVKGEQV